MDEYYIQHCLWQYLSSTFTTFSAFKKFFSTAKKQIQLKYFLVIRNGDSRNYKPPFINILIIY
jgi:hypothetical protein